MGGAEERAAATKAAAEERAVATRAAAAKTIAQKAGSLEF